MNNIFFLGHQVMCFYFSFYFLLITFINTFEKSDQERLAEFLLNECPAKFMLIIKNSKLISKLYKEGMPTLSGKLEIFEFQKKYLVSFRNRNNKDANHLLITNYPINKKR